MGLVLFRLWKAWSLFSDLFIDGLHATFLQRPEDLQWEKIHDLDETKLDHDQLYRKAKNAGLVVEIDNEKCTSKDLLKKLNYLNNFVNARRRIEDNEPVSTSTGSNSNDNRSSLPFKEGLDGKDKDKEFIDERRHLQRGENNIDGFVID